METGNNRVEIHFRRFKQINVGLLLFAFQLLFLAMELAQTQVLFFKILCIIYVLSFPTDILKSPIFRLV